MWENAHAYPCRHRRKDPAPQLQGTTERTTQLIVVDKDLKGFALRVSSKGKRTFIVRAARKLGIVETVLGAAEDITADEARKKASVLIEAARNERRERSPVPRFRR